MWYLIPIILATWEVDINQEDSSFKPGRNLARLHLDQQAQHGGLCL
jgi:fructosamine-3-kinase